MVAELKEIMQVTLYGAIVVTLAMLLRLINCRFIIIMKTQGPMEKAVRII